MTNTTANSYLSVIPGNLLKTPATSNINFSAGQTVANMVETSLVNKEITFYNAFGSTDVIADLEGYVSPATLPGYGLYNPITPIRVADTRPNTFNAYSGKTLSPGSSLTVQITSVGQIPQQNVLGVIANLTITNTTQSGYLTAWNGLGPALNTSVINWEKGQTISNRVVLYLSPTGTISFYNPYGNVDVILDVVGYFTSSDNPSATGYSYNPLTTPIRLVDTRPNTNNTYSGKTLNTSNETLPVNIYSQIPLTAKAITANITATNTTTWSYLTLWPANLTQIPLSSDLNWVTANQTVSNFGDFLIGSSTTTPPNGYINITNAFGDVNVIVDIYGYYS